MLQGSILANKKAPKSQGPGLNSVNQTQSTGAAQAVAAAFVVKWSFGKTRTVLADLVWR